MLQDGYCHIDNVTMTAKITGYVNVTSGDPDALKVAVAKHGPISVAIDASRKTFSFYSSGIYYDPECGKCKWQSSNIMLHYLLTQCCVVSVMHHIEVLKNILIFVDLFRLQSYYNGNSVSESYKKYIQS